MTSPIFPLRKSSRDTLSPSMGLRLCLIGGRHTHIYKYQEIRQLSRSVSRFSVPVFCQHVVLLEPLDVVLPSLISHSAPAARGVEVGGGHQGLGVEDQFIILDCVSVREIEFLFLGFFSFLFFRSINCPTSNVYPQCSFAASIRICAASFGFAAAN